MVSKIGKYLGTFINSKLNCKDYFQDIVTKINKKPQGWKGNLLSQVGRLTLCTSVLHSLPAY